MDASGWGGFFSNNHSVTKTAIILLLDLLGLHDNPHPNQLEWGAESMNYLRDSNA